MKTGIKILALMLMLSFAFNQADAQFVIKIRPAAPRVVRVASPGPNYVWVDEDWAYRNNNYAYNGGHWVAPPRGYAVWVPGRWKNTRRGWIWKEGYWR